ncbi:DUF262 domain-containing HNH endonuclease family protein [Microbacterium sp. EYE_5]|uniref:DUF262 domain-containing protein n=1 Tax=unclassified Microbacterium TaxID=2609290 RepID=UPI002002E6D2|nr:MULTISPECIES: DUF262 domain-containing protein [unclassified Microbacterium]MCK6080907.1 DUF262 domain-containing HNH endonuclease family protein [Microbacterium sp. EYE_382]MCK6086178.1 DUF262 domain-containing HNH endonuclease family protein [Microbacterium sp. EYE_384]MCK6124324.1 DUF262 domain-containing HNH endonuclease family protein [Microbacterium sp. EYE_80]MCK6127233.1 DUF262 domain-containing HNH endonuclease family protein [Microbacterium sp. EYE_79]MCK6141862.1 DUF262 domain-co
MSTAVNVEATAVNTIEWLSASETTIVVPVYQRQYRWDIGGCEQLLGDVRAVAADDVAQTHFIGSILSTASTSPDDDAHLVLIDGQQRITTLMLLIAALHHTLQDDDPALAAELEAVLVRAGDPARTKLRPHRAWADVFERVVLDLPAPNDPDRASRFDDNYAFFRSQIRPDEAADIWRGLRKLEHVSITLGAHANAQQIFESLNSTGEPLRDHELIHNYVLMGLSHAEQSAIEHEYWLPIEENTGEQIGAFWRDYLVMLTGREVLVEGERGVYDAFRHEFPRLDRETLRAHAQEWREMSEIYRLLLEPAMADAGVARHFGAINTLGRGMYPLAMRLYRDHRHGEVSASDLSLTLTHVESLLLRRTVVGLPIDRLVARFCRAADEGMEALVLAIARITPSDERTRVGLRYGGLPHAGFVLSRLAGVDADADVVLDHVLPAAPSDDWTGDGTRRWADLSDDEQNAHRALIDTLGNLTLLEERAADRVFDASFPEKRSEYAASAVEMTRRIADADTWSTARIAERTEQLTARFMETWRRPAVVGIDDDNLTPILDAKKRRGWPRGWQREFDYVEYRGEHWDVRDVRYLFNRVFARLWADSRQSVIDYSARQGGPVYPAMAWNGQWDQLDEGRYLYLGWDSKYMLSAVQGVLDEAGWASEVFVKYSYIGDAMR